MGENTYVEKPAVGGHALQEILARDEAGIADLVAVYEGIEQRYFAAVTAEFQPIQPVGYTTHT
jgi:hypothetical protein